MMKGEERVQDKDLGEPQENKGEGEEGYDEERAVARGSCWLPPLAPALCKEVLEPDCCVIHQVGVVDHGGWRMSAVDIYG